MDFFNKDEKKDGGPVLPGSPFKKTAAFGRSPMFSRAAGTIMDRIKNLSKKDMALVGIGLSVLVMAPVAEFMMNQPTQPPMLSGSAFQQRGPGDSGVYEPGVNGLSVGSPDGSGDVITPLSSRDPASLILGSEPSPAAAAAPVVNTAPPTNWRDSVAESGRSAFSGAANSAGAPTVIPPLRSMLNGFMFGGDATTRTNGVIPADSNIVDRAKSASSKAASRSMVGPVAMAGYKGVASNTPNSASRGAFEALRSQANKAAGEFSGGSAMNSLDKAAADSVDVGKGLGGAGGLSDGEKTGKTSDYDNKYTHQRSGQSLAEKAAEERQEQALQWEFFKKYEIPKQIINAVVGAVAKEIGGFVGDTVHGILNPSTPQPKQFCWKPSGSGWVKAFPWSSCTDKDGKAASMCSDCIERAEDCNPTGPDGACSGGGTGGAGGGSAQAASNGVGHPEVVSPTTKDFDQALIELMKNVKKTAGYKDGSNTEKYLNGTVASAKSANDLMLGQDAVDLPNVMKGVKAKLSDVNGTLSDYQSSVLASETALNDAKTKVQQFINDVNTLLNPSSPQSKTYHDTVLGKSGATAVRSQDSSSIDNSLRDYLTAATSEQAELDKQDVIVAYQKTTVDVMNWQLNEVGSKVDDILSNKANTIGNTAYGVSSSLNGLDPSAPDTKAKVDPQFQKIWTDNGDSVLKNILLLRGADPATNDKSKIDDKAAAEAEDSAWKQFSPTLYFDNHGSDLSGYSNAQVPVAENMVAVIKRGEFELPSEMAVLSSQKDMVKTKADSISSLIDGYRTTLKMNPPSTPGQQSGGQGQQSGGQGQQSGGQGQQSGGQGQQSGGQGQQPGAQGQQSGGQGQQPPAQPQLTDDQKANSEILQKCKTFGVGTQNGADRCSNDQSNVIRNALMSSASNPDNLQRDAQSACNVLSKCNPSGYAAAGCEDIR